MDIFFITLVFFAAVMFLMAIGYIVKGQILKGTCGGLNEVMGGKSACDICERDIKDCPRKKNG
jgi:hypothetical protein